MKKIIFMIFLFFITIVPTAFAHTHLESSTPEAGQEIIQDLHEITLTFGEKVEQGSTFQLLDENGQSVTVDNITVNENQLSGALPDDLINGSYQVVWTIIAADGHQMEGEFRFSVNITEDGASVEENTTTEESSLTNVENGETTDQAKSETTSSVSDEQKANENTSYLVPTILVILVLAIVILYYGIRRKQ